MRGVCLGCNTQGKFETYNFCILARPAGLSATAEVDGAAAADIKQMIDVTAEATTFGRPVSPPCPDDYAVSQC